MTFPVAATNQAQPPTNFHEPVHSLSRLRTILHFLFPGGVLFTLCGALLYSDSWKGIATPQIDIAGLIILVFGVFLAWRFDRNRLFYALTLLLLAELCSRWFVTIKPLPQVIAVLVPFNFILLALFKEKGIRQIYGLLQLALLPLQGVLTYFWLKKGQAAYHDFLIYSHLPKHLPRLPDLFLALLIMALLIQLLRYFYYRNPVEAAFAWAIAGASIASFLSPGVEPTLLRITAALVIIVSVFEMSYNLAYYDELTALPGRRALNEAFRKLGSQYVVAMADIDFFKKLNDTYGHDIGDQVLRMVATRLQRCPGGGRAFRYGGEEFCLLFNGKKVELAAEALEQLRKSIADDPFIIRQKMRPVKKPKKSKANAKTRQSLRVTISIGLAEKSGTRRLPQDVMKAADQALYRAKKAGRNRVVR